MLELNANGSALTFRVIGEEPTVLQAWIIPYEEVTYHLVVDGGPDDGAAFAVTATWVPLPDGEIVVRLRLGTAATPPVEELREPLVEALRAAKRALDPAGILNPGVLVDL